LALARPPRPALRANRFDTVRAPKWHPGESIQAQRADRGHYLTGIGDFMDFNDLALRLERVYVAIGKRADGEIQKYLNVTSVGKADDPNPTFEVSFDNGQSDAETTEIVVAIIEHLAKLKDHLKSKLGRRKKLVEDRINGSFELQLIMDLNTSEKHTYPPTITNRSNKKPRLENISTGLLMPPQAQIAINLTKGKIVDTGNCRIEVESDVVDESGNFICKWSKMVDKAIREWELFIQEYNLN
jgi:hypothetical protein